jgi:sugar phosphate permease
VATFISGASNLGGGLAGGLVGVMIHTSGWSVIFVMWAVCLVVAVVLTRRIGQAGQRAA